MQSIKRMSLAKAKGVVNTRFPRRHTSGTKSASATRKSNEYITRATYQVEWS